MKTTIIDIDYSSLNFENKGCSCFNSDEITRKKLALLSYSISGIIVIEYLNNTVCVAKFTFSPIGDDGHIEMIAGSYTKHSYMIKREIVSHVIASKIMD